MYRYLGWESVGRVPVGTDEDRLRPGGEQAHALGTEAAVSSALILARQPIFDRRLEVIGYELLFRPRASEPAWQDPANGDLMSAQLMLSAVDLGPERLVGDKRLFVNGSRGVITGEVPIVFPPERTVVELLETVEVDNEVLAGVRRLVKQGFTVALDDFRWFEGAEALFELASIVKLDLLELREDELEPLLEHSHELGLTVVAEKVEEWEMLRWCEELGFDYFQGYLLSRPQIVEGKSLEPARLSSIRLASELWDPDANVRTIEQIIRTDPALGYRVLKVASVGTAHGLRRTVRSLTDAVVLVGWRRLQAWVTVMLFADPGQTPEETISTVLVRARLCELLARQVDPVLGDAAFATGMLSGLDLLLGVPGDEVLSELPVAADVRAAILRWEGRLGSLLAEATFLQMGEASMRLDDDVEGNDPLADPSVRQSAYLEAVAWGDAMARSLRAGDEREVKLG